VNANFGRFNQGLISLGGTSLTDTSISGTLSIGSSFTLADSSINVLGADLQLQPLKQGGISFLSGLVHIDESGNLKVSGDAEFDKNVTVYGTLAAGIIAPVPNQDLIIQLGGSQNIAAASPNLTVKNASGSAIFNLDSLGNIVASGSA